MTFGNAWANNTLNYVFRDAQPNYWLSLHSTDPTATGELSTELFGGGYAREQVTFGTASGRMISNNNTIVFEVPNATIRYIGVYVNHDAGGMIAYGALAAPITVSNSDQYIVVPGEFVISL